MKFVEGSSREVDFGGQLASRQLTIKADARAYRNLIDGIYSEKEKTVVREIFANAFDANAAAGRPDHKITVHLPSRFDPTFTVRDYGTGMSHEFVMGHYTCLFESSKQGDNGQTGMFGVGSKAPLSITDNFTIRCFDPEDRMVRSYSVVIPEDGVPQLDFNSHSPCDDDEVECRGVEIIVPVNRGSIERLIDGLIDQQFFWFDKNVEFDEPSVALIKDKMRPSIIKVGEGLFMSRSNHPYGTYGVSSLKCRQGAAVYPLELDQIGIVDDAAKQALIGLAKGHEICIDLPLGTAEVTLAREAIAYGPRTNKNIETRITSVMSRFGEMLSSKIGDATNFRDALKRLCVYVVNKEYDDCKWSERILTSHLLPIVKERVLANWQLTPLGREYYKGKNDKKDEKTLPAKPTLHRKLSASMIGTQRMFIHVSKSAYRGVVSFSSAETYCNVNHPNIVYILPSQVSKWQEKIRSHLGEKFNADPDKFDAPPVQMQVIAIRTGVRKTEEVKKILEGWGVAYEVYTQEDFAPAVRAQISAVRSRNYSKTSVYAAEGNAAWGEKIEPDYNQPAYYIARRGVTHEVTMLDPDKSPAVQNTSNRRHSVSNSTFFSIVAKARDSFGLLEAWPIYRVTEKQAERLYQDKTHKWEFLPDVLYSAVKPLCEPSFKDVLDNTAFMCLNSVLEILNSKETTHSVESVLEWVHEFSNMDPVFEAAVAASYYVYCNAATSRSKRYFVQSFLSNLGLERSLDTASQTHLHELDSEFFARYGYLERLLNGKNDFNKDMEHIGYYLQAYLPVLQKKTHSLSSKLFDDMKPFVATYRQKLNERLDEIKAFKTKQQELSNAA